MLEVAKGSDLRLLADRLADRLGEPQGYPFAPEWVAVPSAGIRFWLARELAGRLGATHGTDGICANVEFVFPGNLRKEVLNASYPDSEDPWAVETLVWHVLAEVTHDPSDMPRSLRGGGREPLYASARHVADLFDRYHHYRPGMIHSWLAGNQVNGSGEPAGAETLWQPILWSRLRKRIDSPSPPERMSAALEAARSGQLQLNLPERIAFFGHATLPGGPQFLELANSVSTERRVTLYLWQPSPELGAEESRWERGQSDPSLFNSRAQRPRSTVKSLPSNPLLRSWAGAARETAVLLKDAESEGLISQENLDGDGGPGAGSPTGPTLLRRVQQDLIRDRVPAGDFLPGETDRSIQFHACQGPTRQVEVLRDVILHILEAEPEMTEDDILVVCPAIDEFAPLIQGIFGRSASAGQRVAEGRVPSIRYRVTDRSLGHANPVAETLTEMLAAVSGRFEVTRILDLISSGPVARRFGFSEDDLQRISTMVEEVSVRWGRSAEHRDRWGLPMSPEEPYELNTWTHGIDRLMAGAATLTGDGNDEAEVVAGDLLPLNLESQGMALAGRLAAALWRIGQWEDLTALSLKPAEWMEILREGVAATCEVPSSQRWQMDSVLDALADMARSVPEFSDVSLDMAELQRLLMERIGGISARAEFFRGGVTISSTTPLRGVPFGAVIMLGMDSERMTLPFADADDLMAVSPLCGDRDPRSELRLELLGAVMSAETHLVVIRDGKDAKTNQPVPPAVPVAELIEVIQQTCESDTDLDGHPVARTFEIHHSRHGFEEGCLAEDAKRSGLTWSGPWTFDPAAVDAAMARRDRVSRPAMFCPEPLPEPEISEIPIDDLRACLGNPIKWFLNRVLDITYPRSDGSPMAALPITLASLDAYAAGDRLLGCLLDSASDSSDPDEIVTAWIRREHPRGQAGPLSLAEMKYRELAEEVKAVAEAACSHGFDPDGDRGVIDVEIDGVRIHGATAAKAVGGSLVSARFTKPKDKDEVESWIDLMAWAASNGSVAAESVCIRRGTKTKARVAKRMIHPTSTLTPTDALARAIQIYRSSFRDPIPVIEGVSRAVAEGGRPEWPPRFPSEATVVFGALELADLTSMPPTHWDPSAADEISRVGMFAELLWGTIRASQVDGAALQEAAMDGDII